YFEAVNLGQLSRLERTSKHLSRMEELAKQALALDETFEHGPPHRFLGLLYHDASGYPFVGVGSMKEAEAHLRRACAMAPDYGYNQLALAKVLISLNRSAEARVRSLLAIQSNPPTGEHEEHKKWVTESQRL